MSTRREFLAAASLVSGGLVVAFFVPPSVRSALAAPEPAAPGADPFAPNAYLRVNRDGTVQVLLAHSEMGQGIWTTLPMLIADELGADWASVRVEHAPAAKEYAHTGFGMQATGGSTTTSSEFDRYRMAGATARALLIEAGAKSLGVAASQCRAESGFVIAGEKRVPFGELVEAAAKLPAPKNVALKAAGDWTIIGKPTKRLDGPEKITGRAQFGMDVRFEGLLTAMVARSPVFGGSVKSFDGTAAKAVPGVKHVVQVPSGVAVVATNAWAAKLGRDALKVEWDPGPNAGLSSATMRTDYRGLAATEGLKAAAAGDADAVLAKSEKVLDAEFWVPYVAHAPMEPLNCTVKPGDKSCEIWTGTQFQTIDQAATAKVFGLEPSQVTVHTTFLGGGFGRRANPVADFVTEAAHVSKAAGAPVKTMWSREDDLHGGYYRPAYLHRVRVALGVNGLPTAWKHVIVGQSLLAGTPFESFMVKDGIDATSVEGVADSPYLPALPAHRVELHSPKPGVPVLWWRSVGHSHSAFVMESMMDDCAKQNGIDPLEYRRRLLKGAPRVLGTVELAAEKAGWGSFLAAGRARGLAVHESFGSVVAHVAEISLEKDRLRVHRVTTAIDCGTAVNPDGVRAQMQGAVAFGLGAALHSELTFADGRVQQSNFHDHRVLRMNEMPQVDVHIVPSTEKPTGVGEPGVPPVAPAVANALFALTGERRRELPLGGARGRA